MVWYKLIDYLLFRWTLSECRDRSIAKGDFLSGLIDLPNVVTIVVFDALVYLVRSESFARATFLYVGYFNLRSIPGEVSYQCVN